MDENNNFNNQEPEINNDQPVADPVFSEPVYYDPEDVNHTENSTNNYNTDYNNSSEGKAGTPGFAIASLVLGIISIVLFCASINIVTGILAIVFGAIHLVKGYQDKRGMAIAGLILAIISIVLYIILLAIGVSALSSGLYDYSTMF